MKQMTKKATSVKNSNAVAKVGNNLQPVSVQDCTTTKSAKVKVSSDERDKADNYTERDIFALCYEALAAVELETLKSSVSLAVIREAVKQGIDTKTLLSGIEKENADTVQRNLQALAKAFLFWYRSFGFLCGERELFKNKYRARRASTKYFALTFQQESTSETTTTFEGGAYYARPTTPTAAGLRTSFNSVQYTRRTLEDLARKQESERKANETRAALVAAGFVSAEFAELLTPSQLVALSEKLAKVEAK